MELDLPIFYQRKIKKRIIIGKVISRVLFPLGHEIHCCINPLKDK